MKKILFIIQREYLLRIRSSGFLLSTIGTPLLIAAITVIPLLLGQRIAGTRDVTVLDQSGDSGLFEAISNRVADSSKKVADYDVGVRFILSQVVVPLDKDIDEVLRAYDLQAEKQANRAYVVLRPTVLDEAQPEYYARNVADLYLASFGRAIGLAITERRFVRRGLDASQVRGYMSVTSLKTIQLGAEGDSQRGLSYIFVAYAMLFAMYLTLLIYGVSVMRGVVEEKQTRIVEVLLSSVKPFELMSGKLLGIGLVGLTQYLVWVSSMLLISSFGATFLGTSASNILKPPVSLLIYFVIYFVLGYFLYATLYMMLGAMVSSEEETSGMQFPMLILLMFPLVVIMIIITDPNSTLSVVLSLFPFNAPMLMILRIAITNPPAWQIVLSMVLMMATTVVAVWVSARIYRVGILMHGKRPSLTELGRWLRYT